MYSQYNPHMMPLNPAADVKSGPTVTAADKIEAVQKAIDCLQQFHKWCEAHIIPAMQLCDEADKRTHRYFADKAHNIVLHKICKARDVYDVELWYKSEEVQPKTYANVWEFLTNTIKGWNRWHDDIHAAANLLVTRHAKSFSTCLYELCCEIEGDVIVEMRRTINRMAAIKAGKTDHDTMLQLATIKDLSRHDLFEKKDG